MSPLASPSLVSPLCVSLLSDSGESPRPTPAYVPSILPLPEGLNLSEAERRLGGRKAREKLRAVVSRVVARTCRLGKEAARGGGFVTLSAQGLERLVGKRYAAPALRALVASGILQAQRSQKTGKHAYAVGRFAKSYRLAPELWRRLAFVPVSDPKLSARLRKDREDSNTLSVCHDSVNTAILANLGRVGVPVSFVGMAATLAEQAGKTPLDVARWQLSAHELATGQLWFSRADAHSRAFHNLTSLPRVLRSRLTLAGEPLAEVDIANAQPLFLLSLYPEGSAERRAFAQTVGRGGFYEALLGSVSEVQQKGGSW